MFRSQKRKLPPLPKPPTNEQIIEDLETFKEDTGEIEILRQLPPDSKNIDRDFWLIYHTFLQDTKVMQTTYNTLEQMKYAVQSTVAEINETTARIKENVAETKTELAHLQRSPSSSSSLAES